MHGEVLKHVLLYFELCLENFDALFPSSFLQLERTQTLAGFADFIHARVVLRECAVSLYARFYTVYGSENGGILVQGVVRLLQFMSVATACAF